MSEEPQREGQPGSQFTSRNEDKEFGSSGANIMFRSFEISLGDRVLRQNGEAIEIGSRAFDLLVVLLRSRGEIVTKNEIVSYVWPSTVVEDSNLRFQMTSLRRVLGQDRELIKTVPGRGYLFTAEQVCDTIDGRTHPGTAASPTLQNATLDLKNVGSLEPPTLPTVVVIDDDEGTRAALEGLLRSAGLRVESFCTVQAFLDDERASPPGCLVLDVCLPGRSGLDFQADLAKAGIVVPVIFISGYADVHMSVRAMKAGAIEFLTKPVRHQELLEAVQLAIMA